MLLLWPRHFGQNPPFFLIRQEDPDVTCFWGLSDLKSNTGIKIERVISVYYIYQHLSTSLDSLQLKFGKWQNNTGSNKK